MVVRHNPHKYATPNGWNDIGTAPKDGTVIEIQNNWGVAPWFGLFKWKEGRGWIGAEDENSGVDEGLHLSWRPYAGGSDYRDPTGGAQESRSYWLHACGRPDLAIKADIEDQSSRYEPDAIVVLNGKQFDAFSEMIENPPPPAKKLRDLFRIRLWW